MNEFKLTPIEHNGERVLTTAQLAEAYGTDINTIKKNFSRNKARYTESKHFYYLSGETLKHFKNEVTNCHLVGKNASSLYLWTERGSLLHAKSLNTDTAWEVYDFLVDTYFRAKELATLTTKQLADIKLMLRETIDSTLTEKTEEIINKAVIRTVQTLIPCFDMLNRKIDSVSEISDKRAENVLIRAVKKYAEKFFGY